jgi:hypothetical protein
VHHAGLGPIHVPGPVGHLDEELRSHDLGWVVYGTNYFSAWADRPFAVSRRRGTDALQINLPFAMRRTAADTRSALKALRAEPIPIEGVTSNCLVPSLVQRSVRPQLGHVPELEDLSLEVMVGHMTRAEALAHLRDD